MSTKEFNPSYTDMIVKGGDARDHDLVIVQILIWSEGIRTLMVLYKHNILIESTTCISVGKNVLSAIIIGCVCVCVCVCVRVCVCVWSGRMCLSPEMLQ
jgi:hypothetical protein